MKSFFEIETYRCLDGSSRASEPISESELVKFDLQVTCKVSHGHGIASRGSEKYPEGTVKLQYPHFRERGLDIGIFFPGTLNLSIEPRTFEITAPTNSLQDVNWYAPRGKTENFLFCDCVVKAPCGAFRGLVYYPDPSTKVAHPDNPSQFQVLAPFIPGLKSGQELILFLISEQIRLIN